MNTGFWNLAANLVYDDPNEIFIPDLWANEALAIMEETMIATNFTYRSFENELAEYGETVNVPIPHEFYATRLPRKGTIDIQDPKGSNRLVKLDQHIDVSFALSDRDLSRSKYDLFKTYLRPALLANARHVDRAVLGQYAQFLQYQIGTSLALTKSNVINVITGARQVMNNNKVPMENRSILWSPISETHVITNDMFLAANTSADEGQMMREAWIGRKLGFDHYMSQNVASVHGTTETSGAVNNVAGYAAGSTVVAVDGYTGEITAGSFIRFATAGVHRVVSATESGGNATSVTITPPLNIAIANNDVFYVGTVDDGSSATYDAGWEGLIEVDDGISFVPQIGQMVSFGASATAAIYTIIDVHTGTGVYNLMFDRPLEAAVDLADGVNYGTNGDFNVALHPNAIALVVRPLMAPPEGNSQVVTHEGLSIRASVFYDYNKKNWVVSLDFLCGVTTLRPELGALVLG